MTFRYALPVVVLATSLSSACKHPEKPAANVTAHSILNSPASIPISVDIMHDSLIVTNLGASTIDDLKLTTYPDPLANNILLVQYGFTKNIGTLDRQASKEVSFNDLINTRNARFSDSTRKRIGACHVFGKIQGQPVGQMFIRRGDRLVIADPKITWGALMEPILGPVDDAKTQDLEVEVNSTAITAPLVIVLINKGGKPIKKLSIMAYPSPADGHSLNPARAYTATVDTVAPDEPIAITTDQFIDSSGHGLSETVRIAVLHFQGEVSGQHRERFVTRTAESRPQ